LVDNQQKNNSKTAFLFPGQGAQFVGMGKELYEQSFAAREVFDKVDSVLEEPISKLMFEGPEDELVKTIHTQPAIMTVSLACLAAMREFLGDKFMPKPAMVAGHSLGEYTALVVAGVVNLDTGVKLVRERGRLMQEACEEEEGLMAAVLGLDEMVMEQICRDSGSYVSNINSANQIVISGNRVAVVRGMEMARLRGAKKIFVLNVGGAFHSDLMSNAAVQLKEFVEKISFNNPKIPVISNCTGQPMLKSHNIREELVSQIVSCVKWKQSISYMLNSGVSNFLELGPGRTLSSLVNRISDKPMTAKSISNLDAISGLDDGSEKVSDS
jgi:[acyl-carrier-protein] S-malonyltransferase